MTAKTWSGACQLRVRRELRSRYVKHGATVDPDVRDRTLKLLGIEVREDPMAGALRTAVELFLDSEVRTRTWDPSPSVHPRDPGGEDGGQFVKNPMGAVAKLLDRLKEWSAGDGPDDPFEGVEREPLRKAAVGQGLKLRRGATRDEIADQLKNHVRDEMKRGRGEEVPSHRLTLSSPAHRDLDVGVYQEKNGKVSLYRESSSGQRGSRIVSVDSLADLEQWGRDHDEPQVVEWAASERGGVKPVKKVAPRKAAKKAAKKVAPGSDLVPVPKSSLPLSEGELVALQLLSAQGWFKGGGWVDSDAVTFMHRQHLESLAEKGWIQKHVAGNGEASYRIDPRSAGAQMGDKNPDGALVGDVIPAKREPAHRQSLSQVHLGAILMAHRTGDGSTFENAPEDGSADESTAMRVRVQRIERVDENGEPTSAPLTPYRRIIGHDVQTGERVQSGPVKGGSYWSVFANPDVDVPADIEGEIVPERRPLPGAAPKKAPGKKATPAKAPVRKVAPKPTEETVADLKAANTRADGEAAVAGLSLAQLKDVARELSIAPRANKAEYAEAIVDGTVGVRLAHAGIMGDGWKDKRTPQERLAALSNPRGAPSTPRKAPAKRVPATPAPAKAVPDVSGDLDEYVASSSYQRAKADLREVAARPILGDPVRQEGDSAFVFVETHEGDTKLVTKDFTRAETELGQPSGHAVRDADSEELGALVGDAVGLRAPAVVRTGPTSIQMEFIDGLVGGGSMRQRDALGLRAFEDYEDTDDGRLIGLLDLITGNSDRGSGNWIVRPDDGRIVSVDMGTAFDPAEFAGGNEGNFAYHFAFDGRWKPNDMDPRDMATIRARLEALKPEFDRLGRGDWHRQMMSRFGQIEKRARGTTRRIPDVPTAPADSLADLTTMDTESARDALDLKKVPELKAMLKAQGLPVSGTKRQLVDRLVEHHGGSPATPPPAAAPRPATARPSVATYSGDYAARQDQLRADHGGEPTVTRLEGGISSDVMLLTYPDGYRLVRKDYSQKPGMKDRKPGDFDRIPADHEELAAKVLDAFGLPTPAVVRVNDHTVDMEFVDGRQGGQSGVLKAPGSVTSSEQGRLLGVADAVMGLRDRNGGGWMRVGDGIVPIDNGGAFSGVGPDQAAYGNPFVSYLMTRNGWKRDVDVDPAQLAEIRTRLEALRPEFVRLGRAREHKDMLGRLDEITQRANPRRAVEAARSQPHPGQRYRHGWIPISGWHTLAERRSAVAEASRSPVVETHGYGGFMGGTSRETHEDGTVLIHKQPKDDRDGAITGVRQADAEELGSMVATALGLQAPAVHRAGPTDLHMEFVAGSHIEHSPLSPWARPPQDIIDSDQGRLLGLLDVLTGNPDRHAGNWLTTDGGGLAPLDNALAFGRHGSSGLSSPFTVYFANEAGNNWADELDLSPDDMATIRERLEGLRPEFDRLDRGDWWQQMMENVEIIEPRAAGTERRVR